MKLTKRIAIVAGACLAAAALTAVPARAATPILVYASPTGSGTACTSSAPCSLSGARSLVETENQNMTADIDVELSGGVYRLSSAFQLGPADSGSNGYHVVWQAVTGQIPVFSGAAQVTGFAQYNAALNIWRAPVTAAEAATGGRQLFVMGQRAQLARSAGAPAGLTVTSTGFFTTDASYASFTNQSRVDVVNESDWKHESCPVSSITAASGGANINILPSCWNANHTNVPNPNFPFNGNGLPAMSGISYVQNAYQLLTQPGQFYLDTAADYLYYIPRAGQNLATADVELPLLQSLMTLQGTPGHLTPVNQNASGTAYSGSGWFVSSGRSYGDFGDDVEATGTNGDSVSYTFTGTGLEVLAETYSDEGTFSVSVDGKADTSQPWTENSSGSTRFAQQVVYAVQGLSQGSHIVTLTKTGGTYLTIDGFEATPAAIAPVHGVTFTGVTFTGTTWNTPQTAGYLDNQAGVLWDPTVTPIAPVLVPAAVTVSRGTDITFARDVFQHLGATAVALADGTQNSTVTASTITDTAGGGISVGNVDDYFQTNTALMNSGDTLSDNEISFVGQNYSDTVGVFAGYTRALTITHNDIGYTPYSGISLGWGWGWQSDCTLQARQGLSVCRHGTNYAGGNQITNNYVHDVMGVLYDGGPIYTNGGQGLGTGVSSGPCQQTSTLSGNVVADGNHTNNMLYHDEGSSCWNTYNNVIEFGGSDWVGMWTPTINTINIHDNYSDNATYNNNGTNITFNQATIVSGGAWPSAAQTLISQAGVPTQYAPVTGRVDDASLAIAYTGAWFHNGFRGYGDYNDGVHATANNGDAASLTFTGTGVAVLGETNSDQGSDEIYLDGVDKGAVNTNTASRQVQHVIYQATGLAPGAHTVRLVKNSGSYATLDGFEVTSTIDDTNAAVAYTGASWFASGSRGLGDYGDDVHAATANGDSATVAFYGTGITYYTETNSDEGTIVVTLDGTAQPSINANTATRQVQQPLYTVSGLSLGLHTLTLTKQTGTYLLVDRFDVQ